MSANHYLNHGVNDIENRSKDCDASDLRHERLIAGPSSRHCHGGPNVQSDTSVDSRVAPGDPDKQTHSATKFSVSGEVAGRLEEQTSGTEARTEERRDHSANGDPGGDVEDVGF